MRRYVLFLFLIALMIVPHSIQAQNSFGSVLGTVTDTSAAVVVSAAVTVTNMDTNVANQTTTNASGDFNVPNLIPGKYQVTIEVAGFKTFEASNLVLLVDQKLRVDAVLQPGAVSTKMEVSAVAQMVDTDSSTVGKVVENKQIVDLPLVSRNFLGLASLSPGTMADTQNELGASVTYWREPLSGGALFIGGGRSTDNQYLIDGVDDNDPGFQSPGITPPIDAIEEFKLMARNYGAEYGGSASQVNIAIKSGTNTFHGTGYEFLRNDVLDARSFFDVTNPLTGKSKSQLRYNQFGGTLGGPIIKDRWFIFGSYEGERQLQYNISTGRFPTPAQIAGDFSGLTSTIYDPTTGQPFSGNKIPTGRLDATALKTVSLGLFATPNVVGQPGYNTVKLLITPEPINQYHIRSDLKISDKDTLFVRLSRQRLTYDRPYIAAFGGQSGLQNGDQVVVGETRMISPSTINEFRLSFFRPRSFQAQEDPGGVNIAGQLFTGTEQDPTAFGAPTMGFTNYSQIGGNSSGPLDYVTDSWELNDGLTWNHGSHTIKAGLDFRKFMYKESNAYNVRGLIQFNGLFTSGFDSSGNAIPGTGDAIGDFMLGMPVSGTVGQGLITSWFHSTYQNYFVQDDYKVTRRLTLNLGLRYEYRAPYAEEFNRISTFNPAYPGGGILSPNQAEVQAVNAPILGYTPYRGLTKPQKLDFAPRVGFAFRPFSDNKTVVRGAWGLFYDTFQFNELIFSVIAPPWQKNSALSGTRAAPLAFGQLFPVVPTPVPTNNIGMLSLDQNNVTPYVQQWNFSVERELRPGELVELSYMGSKGTHLAERNTPAQGQIITPGQAPYFHFPNFGYVLNDSTFSYSTYEGLTARYEKRFEHGFYFATHYTWSRTLSLGSEVESVAQNYWDRAADYGPASFDAKQRVVFSGIYELPFGHGKALGNSLTGPLNKIVSGWQANGTYVIQGGLPYSIGASDFSGTSGIFTSPRADLVGNPHSADPVDSTRVFNRYAFAQPGQYTFGNTGVGILRGNIMNNADLSLFKNTYATERLNVQFRCEMFNAFNHTQLGPFPGTGFSLDPSSSFGVYRELSHNPRVIQLALKLIF